MTAVTSLKADGLHFGTCVVLVVLSVNVSQSLYTQYKSWIYSESSFAQFAEQSLPDTFSKENKR